MGSFAYLTVDGYPLLSNKNGYNQDILDLLFQPKDFVTEKRQLKSMNPLIWGDAYMHEEGSYEFKGFMQLAAVCRQRLEVFGMSLKKAREDFLIAKTVDVFNDFDVQYEFPISKVTFRRYLHELSDIFLRKEINFEYRFNSLRATLISDGLGIPGQTLIGKLYSVLASIPDNVVVEYELTEIIDNEYVRLNDVLSIKSKKILVLTEGRTDTEFISSTMKLTHPLLYPYYHFVDFEEYRVESGASALVKLVIALAASNIKHPIVVLFDNDTTGESEMRKLKSVDLGSHIKVFRYPDLRLARKYPTIGPTGLKSMNINGLACGIEMYLGQDVLISEGELVPIRWKAFNEKENKYQGELADKNLVQEQFRNKIKSNNLGDISGLQLIIQCIFNAFQD